MADDAQVIRSIDWRQALPFTHLFRGFRVAIHPSKLLLALAALVLVYVGGRILDSAWPQRHSALPGEILLYEMSLTRDSFAESLAVRDAADRTAKPFISLLTYQINQVEGVVGGVIGGNWLGQRGVVGSIANFFAVGPVWAFRYHPVFFGLFFLWFLVVWSIFGGAIARIAAVHVARDEKISIPQALRFSLGKFLSFFFAPLIPLLIVLAVGLAVTLGALLTNIPYLGPILVGVLFFLALAAGFVMTLVLVGTIGGFTLMYPTIAVEGSDSFDAISRSFSYLYARPWRLGFYTLVAIIYGAVTYLFVRVFIWLLLALTHYFVDLGVFVDARNEQPLWPTLWPTPRAYSSLTYSIEFPALNWGGDVGASLIALWVYLVIGLLGAYAISYFFSANTIVYYLMRREVDATEMDDVYLEQAEEEFGETAPAGEGAQPAPPAQPPGGPPPADAPAAPAPQDSPTGSRSENP